MENIRARDSNHDTVIVGGGIAGLSAALMLGRARRDVLVIDSGLPRNRYAAHMHAVLGHEGVDPADLLRTGRTEASGYGVRFTPGEVVRVDEVAGGLRVITDDGTTRLARSLVLATGVTDRLAEVDGLAARWGVSVLHCPYCHGWEVRDQRLGVLASSPLSIHQAQMLRQWSDDVTFFAAAAAPLDEPTRARLESRRVRIVDEPVTELFGSGTSLAGARLADGSTVKIDALFTAGTPEPHDRMLDSLTLKRTDGPVGTVIETDTVGRTSHPRVWAAGNVVAPMANVPLAMGAGSLAGAAVNGALVEEDFDAALNVVAGAR